MAENPRNRNPLDMDEGSRQRADYRPTSSTCRNPPRPIDTLSRFLLAMHGYPRASPETLLRLAS